ncbi:glyoxalase [Abyssalbus ytuae]|uniref:Glyoxalase n=1 Tax=Abyssalbus ytuae TaxID=2926907 RepID=A0A9E6ZKV9_9FLAO|nr:glyoxalase [Abyssalbus ytuae]UOB17624.1 glyoxalase [Abyssalbus ytuae]
MNDRSNDLLKVRPEIPSAKVTPNMSSDERFQNQTIRPVIKLQNSLLIEVFRNYVNKHKGEFYDLTIEQKLLFIERSIQRDVKFRNSLKGIIIGQFTVEEYLRYIENSSALNKRMMNLVISRLQDQIQLFERIAVA